MPRSFASKSTLAAWVIGAALGVGLDVSWVTGDEAYGQASHPRAFLEAHRLGYVLVIAANRCVSGQGAEAAALLGAP
ncbi:hypothetical protein [Streptosporangium sp. NPDC020145]|uniref:hypothetical protein n=1 Tax=Streptosporangium sp. NPDC020145 TaxID=3154694 RepID=UPI0034237223